MPDRTSEKLGIWTAAALAAGILAADLVIPGPLSVVLLPALLGKKQKRRKKPLRMRPATNIACLHPNGSITVAARNPKVKAGTPKPGTQAWDKHVQDVKATLAKADIHLGKALGAGMWGQAFTVTDAEGRPLDRIVKITRDSTEVAAAHRVLQAVGKKETTWGKLPALVRFDCAWAILDAKGHGTGLYVIVAERLVGKALPDNAKEFLTEVNAEDLLGDWKTKAKAHHLRTPEAERLARTVQELHRIGIPWHDVHDENVLGTKDGHWKIIDIGYIHMQGGPAKSKVPGVKAKARAKGQEERLPAAPAAALEAGLPPAAERRRRLHEAALQGVAGRDWYDRAEREIRTVARAWGVDPVYVAMAVAATSPATPVISSLRMTRGGGSGSNIGKARRVVKALAAGRSALDVVHPKSPGASLLVAFEACHTDVSTPRQCLETAFPNPDTTKTHAFVRNLLGDKNAVTVDTLIGRGVGAPVDAAGVPRVTPPRYRLIAEDIRAVARDLGWAPHEVMAAAWTAWGGSGDLELGTRREHEIQGRGAAVEKLSTAEALDAPQTETPAFKAWFSGSKAGDAEGRPLVLYRGARRAPADSGRMHTTQGRATLSFTDDPQVAAVYARQLGGLFGVGAGEYGAGSNMMAVYLSMQNPLDLRGQGETITLAGLLDELPEWDFETTATRKPGAVTREDLAEAIEEMDRLVERTGAHVEIEVGGGRLPADTFEDVAAYIRKRRKADPDGTDLYYALAGAEFDTYLVADSPGLVDLLRRLGFDGVIHEDVFDVGEKFYEGSPPETVTTWRPFDQTQVKSATGNVGTFDPEDHRIERLPTEEDDEDGDSWPAHRIGLPEPPPRWKGGRVPNVDPHKRDLMDSVSRVTAESVRRDYRAEHGGDALDVYFAYVPVDEIPEPSLAEEAMGSGELEQCQREARRDYRNCEDPDEEEDAFCDDQLAQDLERCEWTYPKGGGYDWSEIQRGGTYPAPKLHVSTRGNVSIIDGNHRLTHWGQQGGYTHIPVWVVQEMGGSRTIEKLPTATKGTEPTRSLFVYGTARAGGDNHWRFRGEFQGKGTLHGYRRAEREGGPAILPDPKHAVEGELYEVRDLGGLDAYEAPWRRVPVEVVGPRGKLSAWVYVPPEVHPQRATMELLPTGREPEIRVGRKTPEQVVVDAYLGADHVGHTEAEPDRPGVWYVQWSWVKPALQGRGIATLMYDRIEAETGARLTHGDIRSSPGALRLWRKRLGKSAAWMLDQYVDWLSEDGSLSQEEAVQQARTDLRFSEKLPRPVNEKLGVVETMLIAADLAMPDPLPGTPGPLTAAILARESLKAADAAKDFDGRDHPWMPWEEIHPALPRLRVLNVSEVARSERGFLTAYRKHGGDPARMRTARAQGKGHSWAAERAAFLARHLAQIEQRHEPLWDADGEPTRRHLALAAWAYTPDRRRWQAWLRRNGAL